MKAIIIFLLGLALILWAPSVFANPQPTCPKLANPCDTVNCNNVNTLKIA